MIFSDKSQATMGFAWVGLAAFAALLGDFSTIGIFLAIAGLHFYNAEKTQ